MFMCVYVLCVCVTMLLSFPQLSGAILSWQVGNSGDEVAFVSTGDIVYAFDGTGPITVAFNASLDSCGASPGDGGNASVPCVARELLVTQLGFVYFSDNIGGLWRLLPYGSGVGTLHSCVATSQVAVCRYFCAVISNRLTHMSTIRMIPIHVLV